MVMGDDGDRILNVVGVLLVLTLVSSLYLVISIGMDPSQSQPDSPTPDTEWRLEHANESSIKLVYTGGDSISGESLSVTVDGRSKSLSLSGRLSKGDAALVKAKRGQVIRLYWQGQNRNRTLLRQW